jgi:hypothetical protein
MKFGLKRSPDLDEPTRHGPISAGPQPLPASPAHARATPRPRKGRSAVTTPVRSGSNSAGGVSASQADRDARRSLSSPLPEPVPSG